jgi:hypothetical protein
MVRADALAQVRRAATAPATKPAIASPAIVTPADRPPDDPIARIRDEGLNRSQVMQTLSYLTDVIGPRLTGSPNLRRANDWTKDKMASWGLVSAHLEAWGPFGRGWSLRRFSAQIIEPQTIPLIGFPKAWSPGFERPMSASVVYIDAKTTADLDKYHGKVRGMIVLASPPREVQAHFEPPGVRVTDAELLQLANASTVREFIPGLARAQTAAERRANFAGPIARARNATTQPTTGPSTRPTTGPAGNPFNSSVVLAFLAKEAAAAVITPSTQGDGGTFFVSGASTLMLDPATGAPRGKNSPWDIDVPATVPQITLAAEHYNRLVRMIEAGERLTMALDLQVQFYQDDLMAYNTIAEIPGTDLKDQIVMLGAHMDSWHSGTGATDNGAGVAAVMEAVRIIKAAKLQPRRTIRVGLWTGEEQGLYGSRAYVKQHFGYYPDDPAPAATRPSTRPTRRSATTAPATTTTSQPARKLTRLPEYNKLAAYFNLDNGTGKIRGVYMQGNEAVRPIFRNWLAPFADLEASTLALSNTGGTDHLSFDAIGLPGFQFIQDPIEYNSRTHHSNADVFDRIQAEDMKQAATILAAFVYDAAMAEEKLPRKGVERE